MPGRELVVGVAAVRGRRRRRAGGARRRDGPRRPRPDRGHRGARRGRARRGRRAPRRGDPRRGRLGRDVRRARRAGRAASSRRSSCWPRSCAGPRSRRPRWSACATSGSPTCSRRRPTRAAARTRRSSSTIYAPSSPYHRPAGGTAETVARSPRRLRAVHDRALVPGRAAVVVAGDVDPDEVARLVERLFGAGPATTRPRATSTTPSRVEARACSSSTARARCSPRSASATPACRATPRLPRALGHGRDPRRPVQLAAEHEPARGEGLHVRRGAGFDLRRARGPFAARAAVDTEVTVPALHEFLVELDRIREAPVTDEELRAARDYLVGVFPLRFETPGPVAGSLAGLFVHDLPDDELARYRGAIEAVTADDVRGSRASTSAPRRPRSCSSATRPVRHGARGGRRRARSRWCATRSPSRSRAGDADELAGPVDSGEGGPAEGAEDPDLPGTDEPADPGTDDESRARYVKPCDRDRTRQLRPRRSPTDAGRRPVRCRA